MAHDSLTIFLLLAVDSLETAALTKAQLADMLFEQIGLNKRESKDMIDAFFDLIVEHLIAGDDVKLSGFGNFQMRVKAPRPGRNPRTGELIPIAARRVVTFHASQKLKDQLQAAAEVTGRRDDTT
jgi:integration host factor subunit alpha